ncbi:prolyl 3-hydroxylase 3-like isoform X1 [Chiloscyllium punctatum]
MLYLAVESLGHHFIDPDSWTPHELIPHSVQNNTRPVNMSIPRSPKGTGQASDSQQKSVLGQEGSMDKLRASAPPLAHLKLVMNGSHLRGTHRVVFDGALTHQECVTLRSVAHTLAVLGEAEPGDNSAHPQSTNLEELSIKTVLMLARDSLVDPPAARLYYHASVRVQRITQQFFTTLPLRPSISILSCRGPVTGDQEASRGTVSRDPCLQEPEGAECWRESLQDSAGDYRGFLYLNDEFDGGEFYFTDQGGKRVSEEISPKCGRLVVFLSGRENAHSVRPVTDGQRCTLTLTLTGRAQHEQEEYPTVESLLELLFPSSSPLGEPGHLLEPAHQDQESPGQLGRAREERSQAREGRQRQRREKQPRPAAGREIPFVRDEL